MFYDVIIAVERWEICCQFGCQCRGDCFQSALNRWCYFDRNRLKIAICSWELGLSNYMYSNIILMFYDVIRAVERWELFCQFGCQCRGDCFQSALIRGLNFDRNHLKMAICSWETGLSNDVFIVTIKTNSDVIRAVERWEICCHHYYYF